MRGNLFAFVRAAVFFFAAAATACDDPLASGSARSYTAVATGGEHTCAIASDQHAYCWGRGAEGQLGTGLKEYRITPTAVAGNLEFISIATGEAHTCGITTGGAGYCWGWNSFYQRGNPTDPRDAEPVPITTNARFTSVTAGAHHACALATDSIAHCWGHNRYGQLGTGSTETGFEPRVSAGAIKFTQLTAGSWHTCGLTAGGAVYCWGRNDHGQLGIGSSTLTVNTPTPVSSSVAFAQVDAGSTHTCAIARDNTTYCWGSNAFGELGNGGVFEEGLPAATAPAPISQQFPQAKFVSAGNSHTCAVGLDDEVRCWGRGLYGQLGVGSFADAYHPQPVNIHRGDGFTVTQLAAGGTTHVCALAYETVYCWGTGRAGQLGLRQSTVATVPQRVAD